MLTRLAIGTAGLALFAAMRPTVPDLAGYAFLTIGFGGLGASLRKRTSTLRASVV